ncbi:MAG: MotA/TolQ/ExbB proton channel family protein [Pseudomonadota bacterium]|nr:MotA/TolQ/ExbB proton channel family protein [Pseudomonadota bacterium]
MKVRALFALLVGMLPGLMVAEPSISLQQLAELTEQQQRDDAITRRQRLAEFVAARDNAEDQVAALREQVRKARDLNARLQSTYDDQRAELERLDEQILERSGDLTAVFAAARQQAAELTASFRDSPASALAPGRASALAQLADTERTLDTDDLEALWHAMRQEILASGQIVRFHAPVITSSGHRETAEVVRMGLFGAVSEGRFLRYDNGLGTLSVLRRQPDAALRELAATYQQASTGRHAMIIDPTHGRLLSLNTQRPDLIERLHQGGQVGYLILALGAAGLLLALWRWVALALTAQRMRHQLTQLNEPTTDNPLGRVLAGYTHKTDDMDSVAMQLEEVILRETPPLTRGEALLKLLAGIAPLLGLLGTVTGMIATFQSISLFGAGDPRLMADGISQALVTTALGLLVAIPLLLAHLLVSARSRQLVNVLEEQSAGLIARSQGWRG